MRASVSINALAASYLLAKVSAHLPTTEIADEIIEPAGLLIVVVIDQHGRINTDVLLRASTPDAESIVWGASIAWAGATSLAVGAESTSIVWGASLRDANHATALRSLVRNAQDSIVWGASTRQSFGALAATPSCGARRAIRLFGVRPPIRLFGARGRTQSSGEPLSRLFGGHQSFGKPLNRLYGGRQIPSSGEPASQSFGALKSLAAPCRLTAKITAI